MKRLWPLIAVSALLLCFLTPGVSFTEDRDTVELARTIYALAKNESYETKLAIGTVVMNRVESAWFANTLGGVLEEQMQFPTGTRYDDASLDAAHAVLTGRRTLSENAVYYQAADSMSLWSDASLIGTVGGYRFYSGTENI